MLFYISGSLHLAVGISICATVYFVVRLVPHRRIHSKLVRIQGAFPLPLYTLAWSAPCAILGTPKGPGLVHAKATVCWLCTPCSNADETGF